jgi:hypothetical protein
MRKLKDKNGRRLPWPCSGNCDDPSLRFEESIEILLFCCGIEMALEGNMSLREGGGPNTTLAYECRKCGRKVAVCDEIEHPGQQTLDDIDATE